MNIHEFQARQLLRDHGIPVKSDFMTSFETSKD
jgi:succinyl-CoA synthetase beta subunit